MDDFDQDLERRGEDMSFELRRQVEATKDQVKQTIDRHGQEVSLDLTRLAQGAKDKADQDFRRYKEILTSEIDGAKSVIENFSQTCKESVEQQIIADTGVFQSCVHMLYISLIANDLYQ